MYAHTLLGWLFPNIFVEHCTLATKLCTASVPTGGKYYPVCFEHYTYFWRLVIHKTVPVAILAQGAGLAQWRRRTRALDDGRRDRSC